MSLPLKSSPLKITDNSSVDRRKFIQVGGALAVGTLAAGTKVGEATAASTVDEKIKKGWIDAHSHIWGRNIDQFPLAQGQTLEDLDPVSFDDQELLAACRPFGVERVVLIQHHIYHGFDNRYLVDAARRHPDRFRVVGMVDDLSPEPGKQMRQLHKERVTGLRITPWIRGADVWLSGSGMADLWETGAETGQAMCCLIDASDLPTVSKMCSKFPKTSVVIDHFARIGVDGMIREADVDQLCGLAKHKQVKVKISAYYALGKKQPPYDDLVPMIRRLLDAYGPERLMWASDAPYQMTDGNTYRASVELITQRLDFLTASDRDWLLRKTAASTYDFDVD